MVTWVTHRKQGRCRGGAARPPADGEGQLTTTWTDTDPLHPLQYFDLRIANTCEIQSVDDEPPGYDH